ncbi:MAG: hypothetical protein IJY27_04450 [Clostridia bacterium]|nr:hypothetical protein [Clostridia bacterium]
MPKIHPADAEAERCLEIQRQTASRGKVADTIMLATLALIILVFGLLIYILPHSTFSEDENRTLQTFPKFSFKALADGSYTADIGTFYADQFPARRAFVQLKGVAELAQLKMQNNSVIPGKDGTLIKRQEYTDYSFARANMSAIADFRATLAEDNIPVTVAIAPRSVDVLAHTLHPLYGDSRSAVIWNVLSEYESDATELRDIMTLHAQLGEYVWYKTDHHWTTAGAYLAYVALGEKLGYEPLPESYFTPETVSDEFYGTTYSSSGLYSTLPDTMQYYRYEGDAGYVVEDMLTGDVLNGFYDTSYLEKKDKYSSFIGENKAHVRIYDTAATEQKPTLVVVKDSYANSLAPFLAIHFDLEVIDLRYYVGSVAELAREKSAAGVMILSGADNIAISDSMTLLRYGMAKKAE